MPGIQWKEASEVISGVDSHSVSAISHILQKTLNSYLEQWPCDNTYVPPLKTQFISYKKGKEGSVSY